MDQADRYPAPQVLWGQGPLTSRFRVGGDYEDNGLVLPWQQDPGNSDIHVLIEDTEGKTRLVNNEDYEPRPVTASQTPSGPETVDSDGASSLIEVFDLGLRAAPIKFQDCWRQLSTDELVKDILDAQQIRENFDICPKPAARVADSVREKCLDSLANSKVKDGTKEYLPIDAFEEIFNIETVKSLVQEMFPKAKGDELEDKIKQVVGNRENRGRRRILGLLVILKQLDNFDTFVQDGIWDCHLPLRRDFETDTHLTNRVASDDGPNVGVAQRTTNLFSAWDGADMRTFYALQPCFFAPYFSIEDDRIHSYFFDKDIVLPFDSLDRVTEGGTALVYKLQIRESHHNFKKLKNDGKPTYFAVKEIHNTDGYAYGKELEALLRGCAKLQPEKHLIRLLFTFRHQGQYYLVFEFADGNLQEFWEKHKVRPSACTERWAASQCRGIARAIKLIHGLSTWPTNKRSTSSRASTSGGVEPQDWGRHGDIKPGNILWFSRHGSDDHLFVVSDLGLARYHTYRTKSLDNRSRVEGYTGLYRAPEMDLNGSKISPKYDIWSLGCVFLEFCIWYLRGSQGLAKFSYDREQDDEPHPSAPNLKEDKYFNLAEGKKKAVVKAVVLKCIDELAISESCPMFIKRMLELIKEGMLVVDVKGRHNISRVCFEIGTIIADLEQPAEDADLSLDIITTRTEPEGELGQVQDAERNESPTTKPELISRDSGQFVMYAGGPAAPTAYARARALSIRTAHSDGSDEARGHREPTTPAVDCSANDHHYQPTETSPPPPPPLTSFLGTKTTAATAVDDTQVASTASRTLQMQLSDSTQATGFDSFVEDSQMQDSRADSGSASSYTATSRPNEEENVEEEGELQQQEQTEVVAIAICARRGSESADADAATTASAACIVGAIRIDQPAVLSSEEQHEHMTGRGAGTDPWSSWPTHGSSATASKFAADDAVARPPSLTLQPQTVMASAIQPVAAPNQKQEQGKGQGQGQKPAAKTPGCVGVRAEVAPETRERRVSRIRQRLKRGWLGIVRTFVRP